MGYRLLERWDDGALVVLFHELADRIALEGFDKCLNLRAIFITLTDGDDVDVGARLILHEEGVLCRDEIGLHRVVRVDDGERHIVKRAGNLSGFDFLKFQMFRVIGNVVDGCLFIDAVFKLE